MTFRQPAEWAPHEAVWIGFPSHADLWEDDLEPARAEVAAFARIVHAGGKGEEVRLVAADPDSVAAAKALAPFATVIQEPFGDIWLRDTGPIILTGDNGRRAARFRFNGWGGKYELEGDDTVGLRLAETLDLDAASHDWVLEGGAIDVDGTGLAVTTEQCLLNPNRNSGLSKAEVESAAARAARHRARAVARRRAAQRPYGRPCRQSRPLRRRGRVGDPDACRRTIPTPRSTRTRETAPRRSAWR